MIVNIQIQFTDDKEDQNDSYGDFMSALQDALHYLIFEDKYCFDGFDNYGNKFYCSRPITTREP